MHRIESRATEPERYYNPIQPRTDWHGFTGLLDSWIKSPTFTHTHYLAPDDYRMAFDHVFLMLGTLRKRMIAIIINDTGGGDDKDEIRLIHQNIKFKIRPL